MKKAVDNLTDMSTFVGYGAYYGISLLRDIIKINDYADLDITSQEIYVSNGT